MATYCGASSTLVFVKKKHSFLSLRAWRDTINLEYFEIDGAVSLGIGYTENRIVLGVESRGRDAAHELAARIWSLCPGRRTDPCAHFGLPHQGLMNS